LSLVGALLLIVDLAAVCNALGGPVSTRVAWLWTALSRPDGLRLLASTWRTPAGKQPALEFLTGYLSSKARSASIICSSFSCFFARCHLGAEQQRRVLLWGVLGAIVLRGLLIVAGTTLLDALCVGGIRFRHPAGRRCRSSDARSNLARRRRCAGRSAGFAIAASATQSGTRLAALFPSAGDRQRLKATDLIFALDSIPAVLAVTRNFVDRVYLEYLSRCSVCASLYFALASMLDRFHLLHYGLACILAFVAFKMLARRAGFDIPVATHRLLVIVSILAIFSVLSMIFPAPAATPSRPA
jgi:tellurite resistance protein TerC